MIYLKKECRSKNEETIAYIYSLTAALDCVNFDKKMTITDLRKTIFTRCTIVLDRCHKVVQKFKEISK